MFIDSKVIKTVINAAKSIFNGCRYMIKFFATVMHVPQVYVVCVRYSTVNIGKCKQQATEL